MLCYVMLCYVMLCYVMLCYVMLCYGLIITIFLNQWLYEPRSTVSLFDVCCVLVLMMEMKPMETYYLCRRYL